jgi:hypothetical protein
MCDEKVGMCVRHKNSKEKALERERERERVRACQESPHKGGKHKLELKD